MSDGTTAPEPVMDEITETPEDVEAQPDDIVEDTSEESVTVNETIKEEPEVFIPIVEDAEVPETIDLSQYPSFFIQNGIANLDIVVGDNAPSSDVVASIGIATNIAAKASGGPLDAKLSSDIVGLFDKNTILLGNPCTNEWIHAVLGREMACAEVLDSYGIVDGEGMIFLFEGSNGKISVVAAGTTSNAVKIVAKVLAKSDTYSISGTKVLVSGTEASPRVVKIE